MVRNSRPTLTDVGDELGLLFDVAEHSCHGMLIGDSSVVQEVCGDLLIGAATDAEKLDLLRGFHLPLCHLHLLLLHFGWCGRGWVVGERGSGYESQGQGKSSCEVKH